jgi:hypothetical protein
MAQVSPIRAASPWLDSLAGRKARRHLAKGLSSEQVVVAAENASRFGERNLAIGLVRDLLLDELAPYRAEAYQPGVMMNRVLRPLGIWVEARALEYRRLLHELLPEDEGSLGDDTPIKTLARRGFAPVPLDFAATETAEAIVDGASYAVARDSYLQRLRLEAAAGRDCELDWLSRRVRLRFIPGDDGIGRLWRAAGQQAPSTPSYGTTLAPRDAARAIVHLAAARDKVETIAALAAGLA